VVAHFGRHPAQPTQRIRACLLVGPFTRAGEWPGGPTHAARKRVPSGDGRDDRERLATVTAQLCIKRHLPHTKALLSTEAVGAAQLSSRNAAHHLCRHLRDAVQHFSE
jgi:hypothetical protein